jgi:hypothetical protein
LGIVATPTKDPIVSQLLDSGEITGASADLAKLMKDNVKELEGVERVIQNAEHALIQGSEMIENGLCHYVGFCQNNPAKDCDEVRKQPGILTANLPDGKYWISGDPSVVPPGITQPAPERVTCMFDEQENGWALLFDDTLLEEISQKVTSPLLKYFRIREVLAYTPQMIHTGTSPVRQTVYYADETHMESTQGHTFEELTTNMWMGQDKWGVENDKGLNYPNNQVHYRWKYFGKVQATSPYRGTLYILDDGDVQDPICRTTLDIGRCEQEFHCQVINDTQIITGPVAQTSFPHTSGGIISLGCTDSEQDFTQCGTCTYEGPLGREDIVQSSIIQKMYGR